MQSFLSKSAERQHFEFPALKIHYFLIGRQNNPLDITYLLGIEKPIERPGIAIRVLASKQNIVDFQN